MAAVEEDVAAVDVVVSTAQPFANSKQSWFLLLRAGLDTWADSMQVAAAADENMLGNDLPEFYLVAAESGLARMQAGGLQKLGTETCAVTGTCV